MQSKPRALRMAPSLDSSARKLKLRYLKRKKAGTHATCSPGQGTHKPGNLNSHPIPQRTPSMAPTTTPSIRGCNFSGPSRQAQSLWSQPCAPQSPAPCPPIMCPRKPCRNVCGPQVERSKQAVAIWGARSGNLRQGEPKTREPVIFRACPSQAWAAGGAVDVGRPCLAAAERPQSIGYDISETDNDDCHVPWSPRKDIRHKHHLHIDTNTCTKMYTYTYTCTSTYAHTYTYESA